MREPDTEFRGCNVSEALLRVRNLKTYFVNGQGTVKAVDGLDLTVGRGRVLCIVGESGSGKSVAALSCMRLIQGPLGRIVDGEILLDGRDLLHLPERRMSDVRGDEIGMIFQEPLSALNPTMKIGDQIGEVLVRHRRMSRRKARAQAVDLLFGMGMPRADEMVRGYPHQLSGGMRQRVMIAMALACRPKLLIADEPTTALDVTIQAQVLDLMRAVQKETGMAIVLVTHDLGVVAEMADDVAVMYAGQIVESGPADDVFDEPLHPYTRALLESTLAIGEGDGHLRFIPGTVPDAAHFPQGCRFADRCALVRPECRERLPELRKLRPGRLVRCRLA